MITCLEVIEHVEGDKIDSFAAALFSLNPLAVVFSTPNADYNKTIWEASGRSRIKNSRHHDHKFEFSRQDFQTWVAKVAKKYSYDSEIWDVGVVDGLEYDPSKGSATHCAMLIRRGEYIGFEKIKELSNGHRQNANFPVVNSLLKLVAAHGGSHAWNRMRKRAPEEDELAGRDYEDSDDEELNNSDEDEAARRSTSDTSQPSKRMRVSTSIC